MVVSYSNADTVILDIAQITLLRVCVYTVATKIGNP